MVTHVLIPATLPGVMDNLRITVGWAWTYLIVAELVAAEKGLGIMILESQRGLRTVCPTSTAIDVLTEAVRSCEIRREPEEARA